MNEKTIIDFLGIQNVWWENKKRFPFHKINLFKRSDYYFLQKTHLNTKEATIITGPRGVGKSTVMFELMRDLIGFPDEIAGNGLDINNIRVRPEKEGFDPKRILYVTFEEERLKKIEILEILKVYAKFVLREDISKLSNQIYVFFDEIQNVNDWGNQIKIIQDLSYPIKMFITGSSSVAMLNEMSKATRRVSPYSMYSLKFFDFLRYKIKDKEFEKVLDEIKDFRKEFINSFEDNDAKCIYEKFIQFYSSLKGWQTQIEMAFDEYLVKGGYPALLEETNYLTCSTILRDTFWLGFHKDLVLAKGISDVTGMKDLIEYISSVSSSETNYTSLMTKSGATTNTDMLKKYLYHLVNSFLVNLSHQLKGKITRRGSIFKIYLTDIAIRNMLQGMLSDLLHNNENEKGLVIETLVFDHLLRFYFKIRPGMPLHYVKDKKEVDIVLKLNGHTIPVEVKKADGPSLSDVLGLRAFCRDQNPGIVSCGKKLALEENIIFLPHWLFILIC